MDALLTQERIGVVYDRVAPVYDVWARLTESRARTKALALAAIRDGEVVLEVAVGTGLAFEEVVRRNPTGRNTGIDVSPGMLERARRRLRGLVGRYELREGTAYDLDVEDQSVDVLLNSYMFDMIPFEDMGGILAEFRRVLRPGGRLVLVNMTPGDGAGTGLFDRVYRLWPAALGGCRGVRMASRLEGAGFDVESREQVSQLFVPSEVIRARKR